MGLDVTAHGEKSAYPAYLGLTRNARSRRARILADAGGEDVRRWQKANSA